MGKKKKYIVEFDRRILFSFLQEKYEVTQFPKHFYMKMSKIFSGKLEGLSKAIPPEHMYDMWTQKSNYLDKVYMNNISKGKTMNGYLRANYDLSIITSKYDDYLKWLDRQKSLTVNEEQLKENITLTNMLYKNNIQNSEIKDDNNSIADILDELI